MRPVTTTETISEKKIYALRHSGATLRQIADRTGTSKEQVRQLLLRRYGSSQHDLMSTEQLRRFFGFSRHHILRLYNDGVITPVREWEVGNGTYRLWSSSAVSKISSYYRADKRCRHCSALLPPKRRVFCSHECYEESHQYRNMSPDGRRRHLESIKRYREKQREPV